MILSSASHASKLYSCSRFWSLIYDYDVQIFINFGKINFGLHTIVFLIIIKSIIAVYLSLESLIFFNFPFSSIS